MKYSVTLPVRRMLLFKLLDREIYMHFAFTSLIACMGIIPL